FADALKNVGRLADAAEALRKLHRKVTDTPHAMPVAALLEQADRLEEVAREVARAGDDEISARGAVNEVWLRAWACYLIGRDGRAVRLAERALADDPKRQHTPGGDDHDLFHVYAAARAAGDAEAGGRGRGLALTWLRAELARRSAEARSDDVSRRLAARRAVRIWQQRRELAAVRDPAPLARLPAAERDAWDVFWKEVSELVRVIDTGSP